MQWNSEAELRPPQVVDKVKRSPILILNADFMGVPNFLCREVRPGINYCPTSHYHFVITSSLDRDHLDQNKI